MERVATRYFLRDKPDLRISAHPVSRSFSLAFDASLRIIEECSGVNRPISAHFGVFE